jgi:predicted RNase H-like HicB family nuclease
MLTFTAIIERCPVTEQYVGHVPALPGAHTHADTLDQLHDNLVEVVTLVLEDREPEPETEFVGTHTVHVHPPCPAHRR